MKNKILVFLMMIVLFITTTVFAATFTDLPADHWAVDYITSLTEQKVINGYPDGTFNPEGTISRGEFLKLVMVASMPKDVKVNLLPIALDHWAGKYLFVAETYGVIAPGELTMENIDLPITRREMAVMLAKADGVFLGKNSSAANSINFTDFDLMDKSELQYLSHAVKEGYLNGYPDGTFGPDKEMTRAEAATVIYRFTNGNVEKEA